MLVGGRLVLDDGIRPYYWASPLFSVGDDSIILRAPILEGVTVLRLLRWTASGTPVWPEVMVGRVPFLLSAQLVQQGCDAIVAWIDDAQRPWLARVRVAP
jgi:hypothetical protein